MIGVCKKCNKETNIIRSYVYNKQIKGDVLLVPCVWCHNEFVIKHPETIKEIDMLSNYKTSFIY